MSQLVLFEDAKFVNLLPLVYWRCVFGLRCGRKSLMDNAARSLGQPVAGAWVREWIEDVAALRYQTPVNRPAAADTLLVSARWLVGEDPEIQPAPYVATRNGDIVYIACDAALADRVSPKMLLDEVASRTLLDEFPSGEVDAELIEYPWDLVSRNGEMLTRHWAFDDRAADGKVSSSAYLINPDYIHIGERSDIKPTAVIDAENGPVFISNDTTIGPHTFIEGPAYIGPGSFVKPFTALRAGTTIGSFCKVAGEISATILTGYTNKQHEGFLGDAYVGSWVNFGAGATNSNLKNTYGEISVQLGDRVVATGKQFVGSVIGDFVRLGIGQLLPTGAVVGFGAMAACGGFAPKHVPSFRWLTGADETATDPSRLLQTAKTMMARRKVHMESVEEALFLRLPELAKRHTV